MIAVSLRFLAGRYHATPWGRHVNEGAVEWPPSPWRILRALVATWKRTLADLAETEVRPILEALAAPPSFVLPSASTGHTRHYMPWEKNWKPEEPEKAKTKVFDAFVAMDSGAETIVFWQDVALSDAQRGILARILANLGFLGRSESWCDARLLDGADATTLDDSANCRVLTNTTPSREEEIVRTLCPEPSSAFANTRFAGSKSRKRGKATVTEDVRTVNYDPDWHLCAETLWLHDKRWSDPPGSRWIPYARPRDCFKIEPRVRPRRTGERPRIHVARYVLDSTVLPLVTETLPVAEAARRALMGIHGRLTERNGARGRSNILSGKDEQDEPLANHRHAYYLPTDEDGDGRLDHLTVYAAGGFGLEERRAFDRLRKLRTGHESEAHHPLRLLLLGMGAPKEHGLGPLQASEVWVSATPYLATRHAKTRGRDRIDMASPEARTAFLQNDIRAQIAAVRPDLTNEGAPEVTLEPLWDDNHVFKLGNRWRTIQFKRFRRKIGDDGGRRLAGAFRLTFRHPVYGPIALGWSSHFGMGLFAPESPSPGKTG